MTKLIPYIKDNFRDGITSMLRSNYGFSQISHFQVFPDRLVQRRGWDNDALTDNEFQNIILASNGKIYGSTTDEGATGVDGLWLKASGGDPEDDGWTTSYAFGQSPTNDFLFEYKGYLMFMDIGDDLNTFRLTGSTVGNNYQTSLTPTTNPQLKDFIKPLHHKKDDYAYFFDAQNVYRLTDAPGTGTWSTVYTVPDSFEISGRIEYGSAMMLGITPLSSSDDCRVLIIDQNLDTNFVLDQFSLGKGELKAMGMCDGVPTAIVQRSELTRTQIRVYRYDGLRFKEVKESRMFSFSMGAYHQEDGEKLYFAGEREGDDSYSVQLFDAFEEQYALGIYSVDGLGRIVCEVNPYEASNINTVSNIGSFYNAEDYWFIPDGSDSLYRTSNNANDYSQPSVITTGILNFGNPLTNKQIKSIIVSHEPSQRDDSVVIQYKRVGDNSWTTALSTTVEGQTRTSATLNADSTEFSVGSEFMVRILATGVRVITGLAVIPSDYQDDFITL